MTQEIVYRSPLGIVLASDSLIIKVEDDGRHQRLAACKLFPLKPWAALVTAGAFVGVRISRQFAAHARDRDLTSIEQLAPAAQSFFEREYGRFIQENQAWFAAHPEAYRSLYVLLAGRSGRDQTLPWQTHLLASEEHALPFQTPSIGELLTIPRHLGLEGQLMIRMKEGASLEDVAAFCHSALQVLAEREPERVGGPFYASILDEQGFRWWPSPAGAGL